MKIYAVADIHGSQYRLNLILGNIERYSPDLVIICGDITQFGPGEVAKNFLNQIPIETFAIQGNIDTPEVSKAINDSNAKNIDLKKIVKKDVSFIGINATKEDQISKFFNNNKNLIDEKSVLITHVPPYKTKDKVFLGQNGGSKELKKIIEQYKPRLVLSGHIHEDPGFTKFKHTTVVNCSMGKRGEGALIEINKDITVKMIE